MVALSCPGEASWMLGTANCLNIAVIALVLNNLIGPFVSISVSLIYVDFYHCNAKNEEKKLFSLSKFRYVVKFWNLHLTKWPLAK